MQGSILVFNAGSSSLKYELLDEAGSLLEGTITGIGQPVTTHHSRLADKPPIEESLACPDQAAAVETVLQTFRGRATPFLSSIQAVGHRVVHGGATLWQPVLVDGAVLDALKRSAELAPLHNRPGLAVIAAARAAFGHVPHIAVFDTGFHHNLPIAAQTYGLPVELAERWSIRRYGFHGISCEYLVRRVTELGIQPCERMAICHLGAGASVTAVRGGQSMDTSMGFTPLEGLLMGSRSGDLDAGAVLFLLRHAGLDVDQLEDVLERESGLRGLGGHSGDYAELEQLANQAHRQARLALQVFAYRVTRYLGAFWAALGGMDLLVFAGGIGEHSPGARINILAPLADAGWLLDPAANAAGAAERRISPAGQVPAVWVIPTRETSQIARRVRELLASTNGGRHQVANVCEGL